MKQITIIGYLGSDAKISPTIDGEQIVLNVATSESYTNAKKEKIETTDWFSCFFRFNKLPEFLKDNLKKGVKVLIIGNLSFSTSVANDKTYFNKNINGRELELLLDKKE